VSLPDAARRRRGQTQPEFRRTPQDMAANGQDRLALEIGGHFLTLSRWKIEREKCIFGYGGVGLSLLWQKCAGKRISTRSQRPTPRSPLHCHAAMNKSG